ncbi:MAG: inositol monophosphatase [Alphaproteobacteria bacterium]|nr:inositol monophosphatase [Alphaproteobacteria bacterium]
MVKVNPEAVENIIREVAETEILPRFGNLKEGDIAYKAADDPVTIADKEAEKALSSRLSALLPGSKVVGEEEFASNRGLLDHFFSESPVWIIDPIDGTRAFMGGKPYFGTIVALVERNQTVAGWLYDPTSKEFVTAEKGSGAYHNGVKLRVLPSAPLEKMKGGLGYAILENLPDTPSFKSALAPSYGRMGYACHEYARLVVDSPHFARPKSPIHFRASLSFCTPWDDAAGVLAHQEAGGYSAHWNGEPFKPSSYGRGLLVAPDRESWLELRQWIAGYCKLGE